MRGGGVSRRRGDFEMVVGRDAAIGDLGHDEKAVRLYLEESFSAEIDGPEANVPLTPSEPVPRSAEDKKSTAFDRRARVPEAPDCEASCTNARETSRLGNGWLRSRDAGHEPLRDEHVRKYEETGGRTGHDWNGASVLILHTRGRKTGETRKFPLIYGRNGNDYVIVASRGGSPENPGWYKNLLAHPDVEIQVHDQILPVTARTASPDEKRRLWPIMTAQWPDYDEYQRKTTREIPVVVLSPR